MASALRSPAARLAYAALAMAEDYALHPDQGLSGRLLPFLRQAVARHPIPGQAIPAP